MKRLLLIDGDEFIFRATAAIERETRWDEQNHVRYANENEAWHNLTGMLNRIFGRFETRDHFLCFSEPPNFRYTVDPTYKNNRASSLKPMCYAALRELVGGDYKVLSMAGLEADDVMGIMATQPSNKQKIIVSQDKDMKTIPTTVWDGKDLQTISPAWADYNHLYQTLIGDTSDGYKGCPKVGPVKAEKLLAFSDEEKLLSYEEQQNLRWKRVVAAYEKAGLNEEHALKQARLARILRSSDWDAEKKVPILWSPSSQS